MYLRRSYLNGQAENRRILGGVGAAIAECKKANRNERIWLALKKGLTLLRGCRGGQWLVSKSVTTEHASLIFDNLDIFRPRSFRSLTNVVANLLAFT